MNPRPRTVEIYASAIARSEIYGTFICSIFMFMYTNMSLTLTFDLVKSLNLIRSVPLKYAHMYQVWRWSMKQFLSYHETSYFHIFIDLCDLWHLTSWPKNLIRSLSPQYAYIYQVWRWLVTRFLSYCENRAIFTYLLTSVTFDLWPYDSKILSDHCYPSMYTFTKYGDD